MNLMNFINLKRLFSYLALIVIVGLGFYFRYKGIADNHSFWADEAYVSSFARDIVTGRSSILQGTQKVWYQPLQILTTTIFFKIFGISEFSARLPSVLFGTLGIVFAFLLAQRLSNAWGGILAAYLYGFSQLNLVNSTQAKPYSAVTALFFLILYLLITKNRSHFKIIFSCIIATLFHLSGFLVWIPYLAIVLSKLPKIKKIVKKPVFLFLITLIFLFGFYFFGIRGPYNNTMYLKNLLLRQYGIFFLFFILSFFLLRKKYKLFVIGLATYTILLLFFWNFGQYSPNIRYLVPFFGIVFVFFGIFWGRIWEYVSLKLKVKSLKLLPIAIIILLYVFGYKLVRLPQIYYSPNADFYGDVQIADYKTIFGFVKKKFPFYNNIAVFNSSPDAQRWYLDKLPDAYFVKKSANYYIFTFENKYVYSSLNEFLKEQSKYPKGILIVEDWESFLPEDIKQYAKKNMKREFRVESLLQAKNDPWPLVVYSWGMD